MRRNTSLLTCAWALAASMFAAAGAAAGPDYPQGRYGISIRLNDPETWEEVPFGQPVVFASAQYCPGSNQTEWGLEVHGKVNLPHPGGTGWTWRVRCTQFYCGSMSETGEYAEMLYYQGNAGPVNWTGQVTGGEWALWVCPKFFGTWGMPAGQYAAWFQLEVNGPGTGGWFPVPNQEVIASFAW